MTTRTRKNAPVIPLSALPSYLRDLTAAELVALALEAQAEATRAAIDGVADLPVVVAGIEAQARAYNDAARETREAADAIAAVYANPNGASPS